MDYYIFLDQICIEKKLTQEVASYKVTKCLSILR
jgi:hypothetical protein